ncbi:MAG: hypothetical protein NTZ48_03465 [Candidatus Omnitrophica bacterium]|nr:hypothetical protein [Candidatus Omnitrophota bacterium]
MEKIKKTQEKFEKAKNEWHLELLKLIPWIIGLDSVIIATTFSYAFDLQKEVFPLRFLGGMALLFIAVSFIAGVYVMKKKCDLLELVAYKNMKEHLHSFDEARAREGILPPEAIKSSEEWEKAVTATEKADKEFQRNLNIPIYTCLFGVILLLMTTVGIVFKNDLSAWKPLCIHTQRP